MDGFQLSDEESEDWNVAIFEKAVSAADDDVVMII